MILSTDSGAGARNDRRDAQSGWMPVAPRPLDPTLGDAFSVAEALRAGHSPSRMRARDLERPFHGVRQLPDAAAPADDDAEPLARDRAARAVVAREVVAYGQVAPPLSFIAGRSAAVLWGLPVDPGTQLCVGVFAPDRAPRRPGIRATKIAPHLATIREVDGVRLTSPATTWAMLGGELSQRELVIMGDAVVCIPRDEAGRPRPDRQLATIARLEAAALVPRRRHRGRLLAALADIRVGSMSPLETDHRLQCAAAGLPEAMLDVEIRDAEGILLGIADAFYPDHGVIVEVEGDHHRTSRGQWLRDIEKHAAYVRAGYEVVRLVGAQVRGRHARGAEVVADSLRRHGWRG